ncbi:hypothetical protein J5N97_000260 [Dioscorea zingiberensis]|uniref:Purine permease 11 n=1 Tax=Dioscorea zingiberensis TaxID=325984 RepID=A0A9D5H1I7_9LILI|nr:hypothetical protein J5N97_000260 [Dioscorea zingiberensis]
MLGFILTLAASATYSLILSLMELTFNKVIKSRELSAVLNMQIYIAASHTAAATAGLFASGEWRDLKGDMEGFKKGRQFYVMTLVWTAICWQVNNVGLVGLIFEVSSLFSNVISSLGITIAPVFAVILLHDKINGIKVISSLMALWGFASYFYQHYLDYKLEKTTNTKPSESTQVTSHELKLRLECAMNAEKAALLPAANLAEQVSNKLSKFQNYMLACLLFISNKKPKFNLNNLSLLEMVLVK